MVLPNDQHFLARRSFEMIQKRAGWLCVLFVSEMLTATAMQHFQDELQKAIVLTLFIPLIMSSGGNSGSQATSLLIRAIALREMQLRDWWRVALRELPTGVTLGAILGLFGIIRITVWQKLGLFDYGEHWQWLCADRRAGGGPPLPRAFLPSQSPSRAVEVKVTFQPNAGPWGGENICSSNSQHPRR